MDPKYISPFITSIKNVFSTMLQLDLEVGEPSIKSTPGSEYDVSGIIGLSGAVSGSVVLSFPSDTSKRIVALFTGEELAISHPDFADAVGELVNMVSGGAKSQFSAGNVSISIPSVVTGKGHQVVMPKDTPCVVIPCSSDCGNLAIEIAIEQAPVPVSGTTQSASA